MTTVGWVIRGLLALIVLLPGSWWVLRFHAESVCRPVCYAASIIRRRCFKRETVKEDLRALTMSTKGRLMSLPDSGHLSLSRPRIAAGGMTLGGEAHSKEEI